MAPGPRQSFALVHFTDPPCSQVFRADDFVDLLTTEDQNQIKWVKIALKKNEPPITAFGTVKEIGKISPRHLNLLVVHFGFACP
jgi:hypothetical protein